MFWKEGVCENRGHPRGICKHGKKGNGLLRKMGDRSKARTGKVGGMERGGGKPCGDRF